MTTFRCDALRPIETIVSSSANQSSTRFSRGAGRAIDGNTNGVYSQGSVTHTSTESQPWWEVALAERSTISSVTLYNRTDSCCTARLNNVHVFISEHPFGDQTLDELLAQPGIRHVYLSGDQSAQNDAPITGTGSYVRVQLAGRGTLSLAEVEVFGYAKGGQ